MTQELVKEAAKLAEQELRDEEKTHIKNVVKVTLEKLRKKETEKQSIEEEIRILRKDIEDMKEGRIDRIKERQDIDVKARDVSVIIIKEKIIEKQVPMWYNPWIIEIKKEYVPYIPVYQYSGQITTHDTIMAGDVFNSASLTFTSTNSNVHLFTTGTYQLSDGTIKYI